MQGDAIVRKWIQRGGRCAGSRLLGSAERWWTPHDRKFLNCGKRATTIVNLETRSEVWCRVLFSQEIGLRYFFFNFHLNSNTSVYLEPVAPVSVSGAVLR